MNKVIVWFRQDLRLHDNEALCEAAQVSSHIVPVYVFDERVLNGKTRFGFEKTGKFRRQFISESVSNLRDNLRSMGSDLIVRTGRPEVELFDLARTLKTSWIFCNRERTPQEVEVQDKLEQRLWSIGQEIRYSRGKMLYYTSDWPNPVTHTPDQFASFLKETERLVAIREPLDIPSIGGTIGLPPDAGEIPERDRRSSSRFRGGESEGLVLLERLRNSLESGESDSNSLMSETHLSPWLSQGCLSPKMVYSSLKTLLAAGNPIAGDMYRGLLMRDYLRLMTKKYYKSVFERSGVSGIDEGLTEDTDESFWSWARGATREPIIDAAMRQLNTTGYLPHKLRYLAARYLIEELGISWRLGASFFESLLVDYDPCSNWVNWCNIAGVGPDVREERAVNYELQAKRLDPTGEYINRWLSVDRAIAGNS